MEHNARNICRTVISGKEQNVDTQMDEFRISILFEYFMNILPNSILFLGLTNRFHNSILFQYFQQRAEALLQDLLTFAVRCERLPPTLRNAFASFSKKSRTLPRNANQIESRDAPRRAPPDFRRAPPDFRRAPPDFRRAPPDFRHQPRFMINGRFKVLEPKSADIFLPHMTPPQQQQQQKAVSTRRSKNTWVFAFAKLGWRLILPGMLRDPAWHVQLREQLSHNDMQIILCQRMSLPVLWVSERFLHCLTM